MYINYKYAAQKELSPFDIITLQTVRQQRTENLEDVLAGLIEDEKLSWYIEQNWVEEIKGKKNDSELAKLRTTKLGNKLLDDISTPEIEIGDVQMFDYLTEMYLQNEDQERIIGNKKKTKQYCAIFRKRLGLTLHEMYWLCWLFLQEYQFTKKLQNIFFDENKHRYGKFEAHFEDSSLFQYYEDNRKKVEDLWSKKIPNN